MFLLISRHRSRPLLRDFPQRAVAIQLLDNPVQFGKTVLPFGQVSTEILNLSQELFYDLHHKSLVLADEVNRLFDPRIKKGPAFLSAVQKKMNEVFEIIFTLPPFCYLELERETPRHLLRLASTDAQSAE